MPIGNLEPVRDFLHVRDVVDAYLALLRQGRAGRGVQRLQRARASAPDDLSTGSRRSSASRREPDARPVRIRARRRPRPGRRLQQAARGDRLGAPISLDDDHRRLLDAASALISRRILLIGSGPIVIGQGAEFDYSGTQAAKALREEGYEVILVNSNPATIMTDPEIADRTYIEPVTPEFVELVIERERPDALLPTMGGQTALNVAMALQRDGVLERYGVELIGANARAIRLAEDREQFAEAMQRIGLATPQGGIARDASTRRSRRSSVTGYPAIIRPSFTLGGTGGGIAYNREEFERSSAAGSSSRRSARC